MAVSKEEILNTISNMTVMEVVELISAMEDKFGVSAAMVAAAPVAAGAAPVAEAQTEFTVRLDFKQFYVHAVTDFEDVADVFHTMII